MDRAYRKCKKARIASPMCGKGKRSRKPDGLLGNFEILPFEVRVLILQKCRIQDLSVLTITSKAMRDLVIEFISNNRIGRQLMEFRELTPASVNEDAIPKEDILRHFQSLGTFSKRSTCLQPTRERLKVIQGRLQKLIGIQCVYCPKPIIYGGMIGFGIFLHTMIAGWDGTECHKVYNAVMNTAGLEKPLEYMLNHKAGTDLRLEFYLRLFLRRVFIDPCRGVTEKSFWISHILKPCPIVNQARLLYLLFGSSIGGRILWREMCDFGPSDSDLVSGPLRDMSAVLKMLSLPSSGWSEDEIFSILEEVIYLPDEWLPENVASLLINCGKEITTKILMSKRINGRIDDISSIIASVCLVCGKKDRNQDFMLDLVNETMLTMEGNKAREHFIGNLMDTIRDSVFDMHSSGDTDTVTFMAAVIDFTRALALQCYNSETCQYKH